MAQIIGVNFFRLPRFIIMFVIIVGLSLMPVCLYIPDKIPFESLGPVGKVLAYLAYDIRGTLKTAWYVTLIIHAMEAVYAFILAGKMGVEGFARIAWFLSTFVFGIGSLSILRSVAEKPSKHRV